MIMGFRPLTGILFFNDAGKERFTYVLKFPSPYGDFVFQQVSKLAKGDRL